MTRGAWLVAAVVCLGVGAAEKPRPLEVLARVLARSDDPAVQRDVLRGMGEALAGRRSVKAPAGWSEVHRKLSGSDDSEVRERVLALSVVFGDPQALVALRRIAEDTKASADTRGRALETLLDKRTKDVPGLLRKLLDDPTLRRAAVRGLAHFDEATTPELLLARYPKLPDAEKADAISTLASRPAYALALLDAIERKRLPRTDLSAYTARQLLGLGNKAVSERLNAVWGNIRPTAKDKEKLLARYLAVANPKALAKANRANGRAVWTKSCASCHLLFGEGQKVGPDLTGSQRAKPEYVLTKVLDPNAAVAKDYQTVRIATTGGRVVQGLVKEENDKVVVLRTQTEEVRILKSDIEERSNQNTSLMPEGQLAMLTDAQVRDLLAYLAGEGQVALPK